MPTGQHQKTWGRYSETKAGGDLILQSLVSVEEIGTNRCGHRPWAVWKAYWRRITTQCDQLSEQSHHRFAAFEHVSPAGPGRIQSPAAVYFTFGLAFVIVFLVLAAQKLDPR